MARKKHAEHANHERWLVSYADFITLLFAFFVVLYSTAQGDQKKAQQLAAAIQMAFEQLGVFPNSSSNAPLTTGQSLAPTPEQIVTKTQSDQLMKTVLPHDQGKSDDPVLEIEDLRRDLEKQLANEIADKKISLRMEPDGLVISLREVGFFDSGSPYLKQKSLDSFAKVAEVLAVRKNMIRIEGHTDDVPIHTAQFASNWELSTARATEVIRLLLVGYKFPPQRLSAAGYAEYHPVANNKTEAGRQVNRRVDIVVLYLKPPVESAVTTAGPQVKTSAYVDLHRAEGRSGGQK
ncbi:MAG TPA: flagellar motor protein MotB [Terriglobales bacterium]|nr:flagellar motor protein MotB [Terriglobales bacterium]